MCIIIARDRNEYVSSFFFFSRGSRRSGGWEIRRSVTGNKDVTCTFRNANSRNVPRADGAMVRVLSCAYKNA